MVWSGRAIDPSAWDELRTRADPESVTFADRRLERAWQRRVLGYEEVVARAQVELQKTGASWIATTDYRTYAMLRWFFNGRVPVIQINERERFLGFRDPGMDLIKGHTGLYVGREPDDISPLWAATTAVKLPLERVDRSWRGVVMDTYVLEKLTGWTPELSPPPDSPLYRARRLAAVIDRDPRLAAFADDPDTQRFRWEF